MYDAKEKEKELGEITDLTKGCCISDRSYFGVFQNQRLTNIKSSYVPKEGLFNDLHLE